MKPQGRENETDGRSTTSTASHPVRTTSTSTAGRWRTVWNEFSSGLGREGLRALSTFVMCGVVLVGGALVMALTWARTDVAAIDVAVRWIALAAGGAVMLTFLASGAVLSERFTGWQICLMLAGVASVSVVVAMSVGDRTWLVRLPAFWVVLLFAIFLVGLLLSAQVGKLWIRTYALTGLVIMGFMLVTIGRNERVNEAISTADSAYLQLEQIRVNSALESADAEDSTVNLAAADALVARLCDLAERNDCAAHTDSAETSSAEPVTLDCLPGWTIAAFVEWTESASIDRDVAATAALARCELRAFDPASISDPSGSSDMVVSDAVDVGTADPATDTAEATQTAETTATTETTVPDRGAVSEEADRIVDVNAQTQASIDARTAVAEAIAVQRSEANFVETLGDGADGVLAAISGPTEFAEFRFSTSTWLALLALALLWYRLVEIRAGGHGLGPVDIVFDETPAVSDGGAADGSSPSGGLNSHLVGQAIFKQAVVQNVPEPGAVPGAQALAPVGDLISSSETTKTFVASGVLEAVQRILAIRSGYTVLYSAHEETNPGRGTDRMTSVVFIRIRDTRNGAQLASMRFESGYLEEAAQLAGYWVAGWIISRSRYVPGWAVWSEREAQAFHSLQWRQGDDLPLRAQGVVDPTQIRAQVNALILTQRAYAYQISPGQATSSRGAGPYTYNALEDFARAAYHRPRYPVARYRRAVALSSLMHEGVQLEKVFLPRDRNADVRFPSETRLLHLFRDLIGYQDTARPHGDSANGKGLTGWIKHVRKNGYFHPDMRREMLVLVRAWLREGQVAVRAGSVAQIRPSERRFWSDFYRTGARRDWTSLIAVSQQIVNIRLAILDEGDFPGDLDSSLVGRANDHRSHWQLSYNIGCYHALLSGWQDKEDNREKAFDWLERCLDRPYSGQLVREWVERDPDLAPIRCEDDPNWQRWSQRVPRMPVQIRLGDISSTVEELQRRLIQLESGSALVADGHFGDETAKAISRFQYRNGLPANGIPDLATLALLESRASSTSQQSATVASS